MRATLLILTAGLAAASPATALVLDVFRVGAGAGCDFATVQQALDAARLSANPSAVLVARNRTYTQQSLQVSESLYVEIDGGYDDCQDASPEGLTALDGTGGTATSVVTITGDGLVTLNNLEITGGDAGVGMGGGVRVLGNGTVQFSRSWLHHNSAASGGGLYADGTGRPQQRIELTNATLLESNFSTFGGGVHLVSTTLDGNLAFIASNIASDSGGGLYATGSIVRFGDSSIYDNEAASDGGGLHANGGSRVTFFMANPQNEAGQMFANRAGRNGGAVYVTANQPGQVSRMDVWAAHLADNRAASGAGVYLKEDNAQPELGIARVIFTANQVEPQAGALREPAYLFRNVAGNPNNPPTTPAYVAQARHGVAQFRLFRTHVNANRGAPLFSLQGRNVDNGASLSLTDSEVANNTTSSLVAAPSGQELQVERVTIAGNLQGNAPTFDLGNVEFALEQSIVHQPGGAVLRRTVESFVEAHNLLVHEVASLPADVSIAQGDPQFMQPPGIHGMDLRLLPTSPAIDFAAASTVTGTNVIDLLGNARVADQPGVPDEFGTLDLGAYELPAIGELLVDGFE